MTAHAAISASLPLWQRAAYQALVEIETRATLDLWTRTRLVSRRSGRRDTTAALRALEAAGLVRSEWGSAGLHWKTVRAELKADPVAKWQRFCGLGRAA